MDAKGISAGSLCEAEEWTILATIFRALRKHQQALIKIQECGRPRIPGKVTARPDGQVLVLVDVGILGYAGFGSPEEDNLGFLRNLARLCSCQRIGCPQSECHP